jgi:hypothetical protein
MALRTGAKLPSLWVFVPATTLAIALGVLNGSFFVSGACCNENFGAHQSSHFGAHLGCWCNAGFPQIVDGFLGLGEVSSAMLDVGTGAKLDLDTDPLERFPLRYARAGHCRMVKKFELAFP